MWEGCPLATQLWRGSRECTVSAELIFLNLLAYQPIAYLSRGAAYQLKQTPRCNALPSLLALSEISRGTGICRSWGIGDIAEEFFLA